MVKKLFLKKLKSLKREGGFWFVRNVLGSIIKHEQIISIDTICSSLRIPKRHSMWRLQCLSLGALIVVSVMATLAFYKSSVNYLFSFYKLLINFCIRMAEPSITIPRFLIRLQSNDLFKVRFNRNNHRE